MRAPRGGCDGGGPGPSPQCALGWGTPPSMHEGSLLDTGCPVTLATRMPFLQAEPSVSSMGPRDWLPLSLRVKALVQETFLRSWIGGESSQSEERTPERGAAPRGRWPCEGSAHRGWALPAKPSLGKPSASLPLSKLPTGGGARNAP